MLVKQIFARSLKLQNAVALSRGYHGGGHHKVSTMNDLPVPQGDWQELHSRRNTKYNTVLLVGISMFGLAIGLAKSTGLINLNYSPPKSID